MCSEGYGGPPLVLRTEEETWGSYRRAVGGAGIADPPVSSSSGRPGQALARPPRRPQRHTSLSPAHRRAPWRDLPERYPLYRDLPPRRFQQWAEEGVLEEVLHTLALDLKERGGLDLSECSVDGTFVGAKKGEDDQWGRPSGGRVRSSWRSGRRFWSSSLAVRTRRVLRAARGGGHARRSDPPWRRAFWARSQSV